MCKGSHDWHQARVLIISQYFPPDYGGGSTRTTNMIKALQTLGFQIEVITTVPHYPEGNRNARTNRKLFLKSKYMGANITQFWMPPISHHTSFGRMLNYAFFTLFSSIGLFLVRKPNLIFAQSPNFFVWFPGIIGKLFRRTLLVANVDDLWPEALVDLGITKSSWIISLLGLLRRLCLTLADHTVCISNTISNHVITQGIPAEKVSTVEVGFDFDRINTVRYRGRRKTTGRLRVVYSGILGPAYDFGVLVKLARICAYQNISATFIIKGRGPELGRIRNAVESSKLDNIEIADSWMSVREHGLFMRKADLFILPMRDNFISSTALPTKLLEYMAFARPVLVIGRGEVAMLVDRAHCGISVEHSDLPNAAQFLSKLQSGKLDANKLGSNGRKFVEQNLSVLQIGRKFSKLFNALFKSRS